MPTDDDELLAQLGQFMNDDGFYRILCYLAQICLARACKAREDNEDPLTGRQWARAAQLLAGAAAEVEV